MPEHVLREAPRWIGAAARLIQTLPAGRYRAMNLMAGWSRAPFRARMPADLGGLSFRCDLNDRLMREVYLTGRYEPQETEIVRGALRAGDVFVDVGANWGYFTLVAAHLVGPNGRVISVEADPRASRSLREHTAENDLQWVTSVELAADRGDGSTVLLAYGDVAAGSANFGVAASTTVVCGGPQFVVPTRSLDDVLDDEGVGRVQLLKMDIEGAEARAVDGLRRRLSAEQIDRILLELHPAHLRDQDSSVDAVVKTLLGHGYQAWHIDHSRSAHRRTATGRMSAASLLTPFSLHAPSTLGEWPHLLWARRGLDPLPS